MHIPLFHVDAFTDHPFGGNPAAVCLLDSWLDDALLRKVAAENNLSATAFLVSQGDKYAIRWFTPRCEVRLCGHATLASAYVVCKILQPKLGSVTFETRFTGTLTVQRQNDLLAMDFPALFSKPAARVPDELDRALGLNQHPTEVREVNDIYLVIFESEKTIQKINPDFTRLEQLHPYAVSVSAPGNNADILSRYFAPSYGVPEDPVTGSAHCALTPYWAKRLGKTQLHARQLSERGGELCCEMAGERVLLKGNAVLVKNATLSI